MSVPPFAKCIVIGYNPADQDSVMVMLAGTGQIIGYPVKMGHHGAADAMRIDQHPLPTRGTWGLVAFSDGDVRNGIWLCSYYPSKQNAVTSPNDDPTVRYRAHWSGDWDYLDGSGLNAHEWADGSYFVAGSGALPDTYRQTVDTDQNVNRTAYSRTERIPNPPSAFPFRYVHSSGTEVQIDASGNVTVTAAGGATAIITGNSGTVEIGAGGEITLTPASTVTVSGDLHATGAIIAGYGGSDQVGLQTHTHPANGQPPTPGT